MTKNVLRIHAFISNESVLSDTVKKKKKCNALERGLKVIWINVLHF